MTLPQLSVTTTTKTTATTTTTTTTATATTMMTTTATMGSWTALGDDRHTLTGAQHGRSPHSPTPGDWRRRAARPRDVNAKRVRRRPHTRVVAAHASATHAHASDNQQRRLRVHKRARNTHTHTHTHTRCRRYVRCLWRDVGARRVQRALVAGARAARGRKRLSARGAASAFAGVAVAVEAPTGYGPFNDRTPSSLL